MDKLKLTGEQLKNYLFAGVILYSPTNALGSRIKIALEPRHIGKNGIENGLEHYKPAFYRLSDLDKFIPELEFVPLDELYFEAGHSRPVKNERSFNLWKKSMVEEVLILTHNEIQFWVLSKLFQWHFWPFGDEYFEQGLILDKLALEGSKNGQ